MKYGVIRLDRKPYTFSKLHETLSLAIEEARRLANSEMVEFTIVQVHEEKIKPKKPQLPDELRGYALCSDTLQELVGTINQLIRYLKERDREL